LAEYDKLTNFYGFGGNNNKLSQNNMVLKHSSVLVHDMNKKFKDTNVGTRKNSNKFVSFKLLSKKGNDKKKNSVSTKVGVINIPKNDAFIRKRINNKKKHKKEVDHKDVTKQLLLNDGFSDEN